MLLPMCASETLSDELSDSEFFERQAVAATKLSRHWARLGFREVLSEPGSFPHQFLEASKWTSVVQPKHSVLNLAVSLPTPPLHLSPADQELRDLCDGEDPQNSRRRVPPSVAQLKAALQRGANPQKANALHFCIGNSDRDALQCLLDAGADANHTDEMGDTPLHIAVKSAACSPPGTKKDLVRMLLAHGARTDIQNNAKKTPFEIASKMHNDCVKHRKEWLKKGYDQCFAPELRQQELQKGFSSGYEDFLEALRQPAAKRAAASSAPSKFTRLRTEGSC